MPRLINKKKIINYYPYFIIMVVSLFLLTPQILQRSLIFSADWLFHMNRFYETSMQIKNGTYNYFQSIYGFNQSGRVINAMYGADFAYFSGLILSIVNSWYRFELILNFLCLLIAGVNMYLLVQSLNLTKKISLLCSILYMGTPSILYWITHQGFSGIGYSLLPLAMISAVRMVENKKKTIHPVLLGATMALLISVHLFTAFLAVLLLIPFFCYSFFYSKKKLKLLISASQAVIISICLSANTIASYIEMQSNTMVFPFVPDELYSTTTLLSMNAMNYRNFGLILSILFIFQIIYTFGNWKKITHTEKLITILGSIFLLFSSSYFPWNHLTSVFPFLLKIQFLRRFMGIPSLLLILSFGFTISRIMNTIKNISSKQLFYMILLTLTLMNLTYGTRLIDNQAKLWSSDNPLSADTNASHQLINDPNEIRRLLSSTSLSDAFKVSEKPTPDYLPKGDHLESGYSTYSKEIQNNPLNVIKNISTNNGLELQWDSNNVSDEYITLPIIIYKNSNIVLNGKTLSDSQYETSEIGSLILKNNHQFNTVEVTYNPNGYFYLSLLVKCLSLLLLLFYCIKHMIK